MNNYRVFNCLDKFNDLVFECVHYIINNYNDVDLVGFNYSQEEKDLLLSLEGAKGYFIDQLEDQGKECHYYDNLDFKRLIQQLSNEVNKQLIARNHELIQPSDSKQARYKEVVYKKLVIDFLNKEYHEQDLDVTMQEFIKDLISGDIPKIECFN